MDIARFMLSDSQMLDVAQQTRSSMNSLATAAETKEVSFDTTMREHIDGCSQIDDCAQAIESRDKEGSAELVQSLRDSLAGLTEKMSGWNYENNFTEWLEKQWVNTDTDITAPIFEDLKMFKEFYPNLAFQGLANSKQ